MRQISRWLGSEAHCIRSERCIYCAWHHNTMYPFVGGEHHGDCSIRAAGQWDKHMMQKGTKGSRIMQRREP